MPCEECEKREKADERLAELVQKRLAVLQEKPETEKALEPVTGATFNQGGTVTTTGTVPATAGTLLLPPNVEAKGKPTEDNRVDAAVVGDLIAFAGRPWCLKPEAMDMLCSAITGGITAGEMVKTEPPKPRRHGGIAVIPLNGLITPTGNRGTLLGALMGESGGLQDFRAGLSAAASDPDVKSIVIDVNSPGGLVDQVPETAAMIRRVRERKPITAVASTQAASAGYWLASQANNVIVTPSGEVGSIGCYMLHTDKSKALEQHGMSVTLTSAGKYKTEGNQYQPLSVSGREAQQQKVDRFYSKFVSDVADGRRVSEDTVRNGYGEGRTLLAEDAVEHGLADRVASVEQVVGEGLTQLAESRPQVTSIEEARARADVMFG